MEEIIKLSEEANRLFSEAKYQEALSIYYQVYAMDLNNSVSCCNIGIAYEMLGEFEMAVAYYKKSIRLNDKNVRAVNNLARIYVDIVKDYDIAVQYLDYAIEISPDDAEGYNTYGNLSFIRKDYKMAESYFKKSIFLDEKFFKNYYDLGRVYSEQKNTEKAKEILKKCLELNPDFSPAVELIREL